MGGFCSESGVGPVATIVIEPCGQICSAGWFAIANASQHESIACVTALVRTVHIRDRSKKRVEPP